MRVKRTARANVSREIFEAEQRRDGFDKIHAGTKGKARAIRARNSGKKRGIRVGTALEPRKIGKVFHGDACHGNVERARYTEKHGFDPAAWCLSLSIF